MNRAVAVRQSIVTRYLPATNTKPGRVVATSTSGLRLIMSEPVTCQRTEDWHAAAALALARRLEWEGTMTAGALPRGFVFVFTDSPTWAI